MDYLLLIMRDETLTVELRMEAAKAAAPFVHPKLASIEHKGDADNQLIINGFSWMTEDEARCRGWLDDDAERLH